MYRPNFCAQCGDKIVRLKWRVWTSRRFCDNCARRCRQWKTPLLCAVSLLLIGFIFGRSGRPPGPPLIIERQTNSILNQPAENDRAPLRPDKPAAEPQASHSAVYICGARTKKGRPCSRRMPEPIRCWQHLGAPAMFAVEKLRVKD
jgi:hypothetical protein